MRIQTKVFLPNNKATSSEIAPSVAGKHVFDDSPKPEEERRVREIVAANKARREQLDKSRKTT